MALTRWIACIAFLAFATLGVETAEAQKKKERSPESRRSEQSQSAGDRNRGGERQRARQRGGQRGGDHGGGRRGGGQAGRQGPWNGEGPPNMGRNWARQVWGDQRNGAAPNWGDGGRGGYQNPNPDWNRGGRDGGSGRGGRDGGPDRDRGGQHGDRHRGGGQGRDPGGEYGGRNRGGHVDWGNHRGGDHDRGRRGGRGEYGGRDRDHHYDRGHDRRSPRHHSGRRHHSRGPNYHGGHRSRHGSHRHHPRHYYAYHPPKFSFNIVWGSPYYRSGVYFISPHRYHPPHYVYTYAHPLRRVYHGVTIIREIGPAYYGFGYYYDDQSAWRWLGLTAIALPETRYLNEWQLRAHEQALINAMTAEPGKVIQWSLDDAWGEIQVLRLGEDANGYPCREISQDLVIGGRRGWSTFTACQDARGAWIGYASDV